MQIEITLALPNLDIRRLVTRVAILAALFLAGMAAAILAIVFFCTLAWQVLLAACLWAVHLDLSAQILLLIILGFVFLRCGSAAGRLYRAVHAR